MPKALDLTGQRFGSLVALSKAESRKGKTYWLCRCDCGNEKEIQTGHLTSGVTTSCGCLQSLSQKDRNNLVGKTRYCEICGQPFEIMDNGWTRKYCYNCAPHEDENMSHSKAVMIKRRAIKKALIDYKGGKCCRCGYDKSLRALEFHHTDPSIKDFGISKCLTRSMESLKEEVDKCILVCSNCHAEIHDELIAQGYEELDNE